MIEELLQPKKEVKEKQELIEKMFSADLSSEERVRYVDMLSHFPDLFITSYEEIRGFKGPDLKI